MDDDREMEELEQGPMFHPEELPPDHRSGFVALAGKPNVGKSTLLNAWLGTRLAPVSPRPQTTRNVLLGILTRPDAQVIFVDTPGIHLPQTKLGDYMVESARRAIVDADVVVFLVDITEPPSRADEEVARILAGVPDVPVILTMNKVDLVTEEVRERHAGAYRALGTFAHEMAISALTGTHCAELLEWLVARLPNGPRYYPEEQISDQQERFIAAELIREHIMRFLEQEVPHATAVQVYEFEDADNGMLRISAYIFTEKESQKGIVIGRRGEMLKRIGQAARLALEEFFGRRVYLELWVKVRKNWRRNEHYLRELGYIIEGPQE